MEISWRPWGSEAFGEAMKEKKPVLLYLGAAWCHWCHVMDKTSFSDPDVVKLIDAKFIPIKVDIDRRPDIRDRYNFGGFPTIAVLNEKAHVLTGTMFIPARQLESMLREIHKIYTEKHEQMQLAPLGERKHPEPGMDKVDENIMPFVTSLLVNGFDREMGGFGKEPKFPAPGAISLLLLNHARTGEPRYLEMARSTLDAMKGLLDDAEGGLYRYSMTRDWKTPRHEKMLDTNAGALMNYLDIYAMAGDAEHKRMAQRIMDYVDSTLRGEGGFSNSQDADEEYYKLPAADRKRRKAPTVDKTIYADANAKMVSAYLRASAVLDDAKRRDIALKCLDFMMTNMFKEGMLHAYDGKADGPGFAADNVSCMKACLDAYEHTADMKHLIYAEKLAAFVARNLVDKHGLHDRVARKDDIGELKSVRRPLEENAMAADAFTSLAILAGNDKYMKTAETMLLGMSGAFEVYGHLAASYAIAADHYLYPLKVIVIGKASEQKTKRLWQGCPGPSTPAKTCCSWTRRRTRGG